MGEMASKYGRIKKVLESQEMEDTGKSSFITERTMPHPSPRPWKCKVSSQVYPKAGISVHELAMTSQPMAVSLGGDITADDGFSWE